MSSLVTQMIVAEKYGVRLNMEQLAAVLKLTVPSLYNQVSSGKLQIPTYMDQGKRWADYRAVADYLDDCADKATAAI